MITQATIEDIDQLAELFDQYRIFYKKNSDVQNAKSFLLERINLKESIIFISKFEEKIIGFVQLYPIFSSTKMKRLWLLNDLFVDSNYRGQGISKKLIEQCKQFSIDTNACGLTLETATTNRIGNQLYPRVGFNIDCDHNHYTWENNES